jgi:uncharacterized protein (DUF58 family)
MLRFAIGLISMDSFIDPKTLARVKDLPFVAKTVAEGFLHGLQSSMQRGVGIEFSQYRPYENGDELSRVDWKLFARSDRYFVREAERESEIDVWLLLDASRSMQQLSEKTKSQQTDVSWTKFDYAKHLIASIGYLAQKQGDSIGYLGLSSEQLNFLPQGNSEKHWRKLLSTLSHTNYGKQFPEINAVKNLIGQLQKPAIIFVFSDFNQKDNEIVEFLGQLNSTLCEVVAIQLVCNDETDFNYKGAIRFKDLETEEEVLVSAGAAKAAYLRNYQAYQQALNETLSKKNIRCHQFNIDQPLDQVLFEYLRQRQRVAR